MSRFGRLELLMESDASSAVAELERVGEMADRARKHDEEESE